METVTLSQALKLLQFPKNLGKHKNKNVVIRSGRFGHYITWDSKNFAIPKTINPFKMNLEGMVRLSMKKENIIKEFKQFDIEMVHGPYIFKDKKFISIHKDKDPTKLTIKIV